MRRIYSIQTRIALVIVVVLLVTLAITSIYYLNTTEETLTDFIIQESQQLAQSNVNRIETLIFQQQADLLFLTQSPNMRQFIESQTFDNVVLNEDIQAFLAEFLRQHPQQYTGLCLLNTIGEETLCFESDGNAVMMIPDDQLDDLQDSDIYLETISRMSIPGQAPPVYISAPELGDTDADSVLHYSVLLQNQRSEIIGVIVLDSSISNFEDIAACQSTCESYFLVDTTGDYLLTSRSDETSNNTLRDAFPTTYQSILAQPSGVFIGIEENSDTLLISERMNPRRQPRLQWTIIYEQSRSVTLQPILNRQNQVLLVTGIALAVALLLAWYLVRTITKPIKSLITATQKIQKQDWDITIEGAGHQDEIGILSNRFETMIQHIRQTQEGLEEAVENRTEQLQRSNNDLLEQIELREAIEDTLRRSEAQLRILTNNASDLICLHYPDMSYRFVSQSVKKVTGYEANTLISTSPYDYYHPNDVASIRHNHARLQDDPHQQVETVSKFLHKSGHYIDLETHTQAVVNANGEITHYVSVSRDVTEQIELQQKLMDSEALLQASINALPAQVVVVNQQGDIIMVNALWRQYAEQNDADIPLTIGVGLNYLQVCDVVADSDHTAHKVAEAMRQILQGEQHEAYFEYLLHEDANTWFEVRISSFYYNQIIHAMLTHMDITDRKVVEVEIRNALEQQIEINRLRSQFISMISHDFRTPLATIQTTTDLLKMYDDRYTKDDRMQRLDRIQSTIDYLANLIDEVVFIGRSQIGEVPLHLTPFDLELFCRDMIVDIELAFKGTGRIDLQWNSDQSILTLDKTLIHKILVNLLSNAMKYSDDKVILSVTKADDSLTFVIEDKGIGIPTIDQIQLFETFHRGRNVGNRQGTGLGLVIVKHSVDTHNGNLSYTSEEGVGTTFTVTLRLHSS